MEARLEAMEQQVFKCQGMVERGLNADHMMINEFTNKHKIDANDIGKHLSRLYDKIDHLQAQIYDLQNQNSFGKLNHNVKFKKPDMKERFERWIVVNGKTYRDEEEKAMRFELFKAALENVESQPLRE
ncbi:40S ribosomal protein S5-1 [Hordeum vulgare]|nr:40S ribosomal protein S5-1 [Hordeum vulgare]